MLKQNISNTSKQLLYVQTLRMKEYQKVWDHMKNEDVQQPVLKTIDQKHDFEQYSNAENPEHIQMSQYDEDMDEEQEVTTNCDTSLSKCN